MKKRWKHALSVCVILTLLGVASSYKTTRIRRRATMISRRSLAHKTILTTLAVAALLASPSPSSPSLLRPANALSMPQSTVSVLPKAPTSADQGHSMVAYKALSIVGDLGVTVPVACWFPMDATASDSVPAEGTTSDVRYQHRISVRKIGQLLAGWDFIPEFVSRDFAMAPTLSSGVIAAGDDATLPSKAPVVILAHGYLGSRFDLSHLAECLASRGFLCLAPEYPESLAASFESGTSSGESKERSPVTRARITSTLLETLQSDWNVRPTSYGIVGHSLGCGTALETGDDSWARVLIAGFPRTRDGRPIPGNLLLLMSMNDGAVSLSRWGGKEAIPSDFALLSPEDAAASTSAAGSRRRLPGRAAVVLEGDDAPNHISFLADNVNTAMIDLLSPLLPLAQALKIPVLDFDRYQRSRDSVSTAKIVHPLVVQYLSERMVQ
jgi:dienelactone hydrolase